MKKWSKSAIILLQCCLFVGFSVLTVFVYGTGSGSSFYDADSVDNVPDDSGDIYYDDADYEDDEEELDKAELNPCTCDSELELHLHADACERKQYVLSLIKAENGFYRSASDIYAELSTYNYQTQQDILDMCSAYVFTTYDELIGLIGTAPDGVADDAASGVVLSGVPEGSSAVTSVTAPNKTNWLLFNKYVVDGRRLAFSLDIGVTAGDDSWQPATGQYVSVSVAVDECYEGMTLAILHYHNDELQRLGEYTVQNGTVTFQTDGFSEFYGYTVDFVYDGTYSSMTGGDYIYLTDLFLSLNIDRNVDDVVGVTFSDDSLLEISHFDAIDEYGSDTEWKLQSLQPFDTEELLTVTFSDGEVLLINVYDAITEKTITKSTTWIIGSDSDSNKNTDTVTGLVTFQKSGTIKLTIKKNTNCTKSNITLHFNNKILVKSGTTLQVVKGDGDYDLYLNRTEGYQDLLFDVEPGAKLVITSDNDSYKGVSTNKKSIVFGGGANNYKSATAANQPICPFIALNGDKVTTNGGDAGKLTLKNVEFRNVKTNQKNTRSAAINAFGQTEDAANDIIPRVTISITNCYFHKLESRSGAALYMRTNVGGTVEINGTTFENCVTYGERDTKDLSKFTTSGGVLRCNGACSVQLTVKDCIFRNNGTGYNMQQTSNYPSSHTSSANSTLIAPNNPATKCAGGAIYWNGGGVYDGTPAKLVISGCTFDNNYASYKGGALFTEADTEITNTKFTNNMASGTKTADNSKEAGGGAISLGMYSGGAKGKEDTDFTLTLGEGVVIDNNKADRGGGILFTVPFSKDKNNGITVQLIIDGAQITNNSTIANSPSEATPHGGGIMCFQKEGGLKYNAANDNSKEYKYYNASVLLKSGTISGNTANGKGYGGGLFIENFNVVMGDTSNASATNPIQITGNTAYRGGGVYILNDDIADRYINQKVDIIDCNVSNNTSTLGGAGVFIKNFDETFRSKVNISGGMISNNSAGGNGGGLVTAGIAADVNITGGTITGNSSTTKGGGIQHDNAGTLSISGISTITSNSAPDGGGIYVGGGGSLAVTGGFITNNTATQSGGGVYVGEGAFSISGDNIGLYNNTGGERANDVYASGTNSVVNLPRVSDMNLAGWGTTAKPTGWFADYNDAETNYPSAVIINKYDQQTTNPGRYADGKENVEVLHSVLVNNPTAYYNLTLGVPPITSGQVTIVKNVDKAQSDAQVFLFKLEGTATDTNQYISLTVQVTVPAGQTKGQMTIVTLPKGNYTVSELGSWSWRYDLTSGPVYSCINQPDTSFTQVEMGLSQTEWNVTFGNALSNEQWLSYDSYKQNKFNNPDDSD